jgi:hypothetical protein
MSADRRVGKGREARSIDYGFYLFIDEAGDEGLQTLRTSNPKGSSEYFVLAGLLLRVQRYAELQKFVQDLKAKLGLQPYEEIHFRDLSKKQQDLAIDEIGRFKAGVVAIVSNKRNMIQYRNLRCENSHYEIVNGRQRAVKHNWFYNGLFKYLLERASTECARWSKRLYGENRHIKIVFGDRSNFSYAQTGAYLYKLQTSRHDRSYYNNKGSIDWSVVSPAGIQVSRARTDPGLQLADCLASGIFRAVDENWFGDVRADYIRKIRPLFINKGGDCRDYGFKLMPDDFNGPMSRNQQIALKAAGYKFFNPIRLKRRKTIDKKASS